MSDVFDFSNAYADILLLVGTQTGNAEIVAEAIQEMLERHGFAITILSLMDAEVDVLDMHSQLILCTSTFGEGELPDIAEDFYAALKRQQPDLSHLAFGIIALGDRHYAYFAHAGDVFQEALEVCGAVPVIDIHRIDQGPRPAQIEAAQDWSLQCAAAFSEVFANVE